MYLPLLLHHSAIRGFWVLNLARQMGISLGFLLTVLVGESVAFRRTGNFANPVWQIKLRLFWMQVGTAATNNQATLFNEEHIYLAIANSTCFIDS